MTSSHTINCGVSEWKISCVNRGKPSRYWWVTKGRCDEPNYISEIFKTKKEAHAFMANIDGAKALRTPPTTKVVGIRAGDF